jgi:pyruvate dehydrogenase E2 component (dihydrolipoamide acetyltransferase)
MAEFTMPSLGADMEAGTVLEWLVQPGDEVHRGDIVALIDTDKADIEVEIFFDGVIEELLVPVGAHVPVGTPLARVRTAADAGPAATAEPAVEVVVEAAPPASEPVVEPAPAASEPVAGATDHDPHSPVVRRLARHLSVDLDTVAGTGPGGRVTREDVERAAGGAGPVAAAALPTREPVAPPVEEPERDRAGAMRQAIAALMTRSKREIPHYYVSTQIELSTCLGWLERNNAERPLAERLLPAALLLKAAALTARDHPELNGFWIDDRFQPSEAVHLGVAVSLRGGGLVAPALQHADQLDLAALMNALRDLVQRARAGRLRSSEMSSPTLTVTNLGDQGVEVVQGVIYPPQVALLGLGRVVERPWAERGLLGVRPVLTATLAADHRATDGHLGARFLSTFDRYLQHPEDL